MTTVSRTISYRHVDDAYAGHTGAMNLTYDPDRPFDVAIDFGPDEHPWRIWRDILAGRVDGKAACISGDGQGEGGASCEIGGMWSELTLVGLHSITLRFPTASLTAFLVQTIRLVPFGAEEFSVDAELDALLGGAR